MSEHENSVTVDDEIVGTISAIRDRKAQVALIEEEIAALRAKVEAALGDAEHALDKAGNALAHWTHVTTTTIDAAKVRKLLPAELVDAVSTVRASRRFTLVDPDAS